MERTIRQLAILLCVVAFAPSAGDAFNDAARQSSRLYASASSEASNYSVLYSFTGKSDGANPAAHLVVGTNDSLFGTTEFGGPYNSSCSAGCGTVFRLSRSGSGYVWRLLYAFQGVSDGAEPLSGLAAGAGGVLYGATPLGGGPYCNDHVGCGTIFELSPSSSGYSESVAYAFQNYSYYSDGVYPAAGLVADKNGALYGTTRFGGKGAGTVFKFQPSGQGGTEKAIYSFGGVPDGNTPLAGLLVDADGTLYGSTSAGGAHYNSGTVFELVPSGSSYKETVIHSFWKNTDDGYFPTAAPVLAKGALYGTTREGGGEAKPVGTNLGKGVVYELSPAGRGYKEMVLHAFRGGADGAFPEGSLIGGPRGGLYGTTSAGGGSGCGGIGCGTIFSLSGRGFTTEKVVYVFNSPGNGMEPTGTLVSAGGALFGTTAFGGTSGHGVVFRFVP